MNTKRDGIISGAILLGVCTFITKLLGAFYRIPLTNMIGSYGLGLYQMVFPVYVLLLDFSGAGLPSALSRIIASYTGEDKRAYAKTCLHKAFRFFVLVGVFLSLGLVVLSKPLSILQGDKNAYLGYIFLAPAIIPVVGLSCYRGYFQGLSNFKPTAFSQILEQAIKLVFGFSLVWLFKDNVVIAVACATLAITISELVTFLVLFVIYKKQRNTQTKISVTKDYPDLLKGIFRVIIPITLTSLLIPFSQVIDSFIIINGLSRYSNNSTSMYGILSGVVSTVISLPISICHGISITTIPAISNSTSFEKRCKTQKSLLLTAILSFVFSVFFYICSKQIVGVLFARLNATEKSLAQNLLKVLSCTIFFHSMLQTENAVLVGYGRQGIPPLTMFIGVLVKTIVNLTLITNPKINIYAGAIGLIACYFLPCLINLILIGLVKERNGSKSTKSWRHAN